MTMGGSSGFTGRNPAFSRCVSSAGFSMVEMLLVLGALAVLFGAIYSGFERLNRSYTAENAKAGTQQGARCCRNQYQPTPAGARTPGPGTCP